MNRSSIVQSWMAANRGDLQTGAALLSLACLLVYTFWHTGGLLAHYIHPGAIGYVAAFGVEFAVVSLSLRIGELGWTDKRAAPFKRTLIAVLVVSAFANISEGYRTAFDGQPLTLNAVPTLDIIQAVVGVAATGLLSLIVYWLADIIGSDVRVPSEGVRVQSPPVIVQPVAVTVQASPERPMLTDEQQRLLDYLASNRDASYSDIGAHMDKSKTTASNYVKALMDAGVVTKNGHGWEVLA